MVKTFKNIVKKSLNHAGVSLTRYDPRRDPAQVLMTFLKRANVDLVLDVGANTGQYAQWLRQSGYTGHIVSFEPLKSAFEVLRRTAAADPTWDVINCALGAQAGTAQLNVAGNSYSSSLLGMMPRHAQAAPESGYTGSESVTLQPLDAIFPDLAVGASGTFMKIDAQGYTREILAGARASLHAIRGLQLEMSLISLYEGEALIGDLICEVARCGFSPVFIRPEFTDRQTGQQLQVDGIFFKL
jgi:FkbM family methyltransferase